MAKFTTNLSMATPTETITVSKTGDYVEIFKVNQELSSGLNGNTFLEIIQPSTTSAQSSLKDAKSIVIRNTGLIGAEIQIKTNEWADGSSASDSIAGVSYQSYLLAAGDFIFLSNLRQANFRTDVNSLGNGYVLNNQVPDSNMYVAVNNPAAGDAQLTAEAVNDSETDIDVDDGDFFHVGDLIRIENEIMEVTSISGDTLTVIRGSHGSTVGDYSDDKPIRYAFFNAYADFDKYSVAQTDSSGRFKCSNFFGYARSEGVADGLVPGSISGKFYNQGFQELGLSGIAASTETGLTASTAYEFDIQVDGGTNFDNLSFTTSSNTKFGGSDGIIRKIQDALDAQFYTSGNLFEKRVLVNIIDGDIRFTSGSSLSTSAIALTVGSSGTADFLGAGRIPSPIGTGGGVAEIEQAVASRLPEDILYDRSSGTASANIGAMFYDDGKGNISGTCNGTIDYRTGAMNLNGCPPNAEFVVNAAYGSAHSGENRYADADGNSIMQISGRSASNKIYTTIEVVALR